MNEYINNEIPWKIIKKMIQSENNFFIKHHLDSYNTFFNKGLMEVFKNNNPLEYNRVYDKEASVYKYNFKMYFGGKEGNKIYYGKPVIYDEFDKEKSKEHYMYPNEARLRNMTYGFTIHYDVDVDFMIYIEKNKEKKGLAKYGDPFIETHTLKNIYLGKFPLMLKSDMCILNNLSREICFNMGECRNDPGGYFIIDGKEKCIISQEGRADNMLYIKDSVSDTYSHAVEIRSVSEDTSKPIRTLSIKIVSPQPESEGKQIKVNIPNVREPIPLFITMRALGIISDRDIIEHCLLDMVKYDEYIELFRPSIHDAGYIFTQEAAIKYISTFTKWKTTEYTMQLLMDYLLPHIGELNFKQKALYIGYMVKRLLDVYTKNERPTDRDSFSFKRLETSGILISKLFKEYYKLQLESIYQYIDKKLFYNQKGDMYKDKHFMTLLVGNETDIFSRKIVNDGFRKAFKGDWGSAIHTKKTGLVQDLNRLSFFYTLCQLRKTNLPLSADAAKIVGPRRLHTTQWGLLCPIHSPDGGNIGLHNYLSTSTHITNGVSIKPYINYLRTLKATNGRKKEFIGISLLEECNINKLALDTKVFINGSWIGMTNNPLNLVSAMRYHKRCSVIDKYISIRFDYIKNEILICTDAGRACRPLFYMKGSEYDRADDETMSYTNPLFFKKIEDNTITWKELTCGIELNTLKKFENVLNIKKIENNMGILEFIDTQEAEGIVLAKHNDLPDTFVKKRITHKEIHSSLILGLMANQIIFPENNPYPRNAFSCGQGKQAVSLFHSNYRNRLDKTALLLNYGQIPLTKSRYYDYATKNEHPYGENAIVAIMCYSGFNVEDAIIVNKGSLDRGLFKTTKYAMYETHEEMENIGDSKINTRFMDINNNNVIDKKSGYDYTKLDSNGLIKINTIVDDKTILIGKSMINIENTNTYIDMSIAPKKGEVGVVDKVFMTSGLEGKRIAKVRIRSIRTPVMGDKFCSRAGQKGTIGIILDEIDMPTTNNGLKPDIIVNPHAMPSRMTIGHLVETITSKVGCIYGGFGDCTAFCSKGLQHEIYGKYLTKAGYEKLGEDVLYNGMTGEQLETSIYIGPTYYERLKHMPKDKINYRARGPREVLTRQTVHGRAKGGGLRVGEMDRDSIISHGLSSFMKESMLVRGDEFKVAICNQSGCIAAYNENLDIYLCPFSDGPIQFDNITEYNANLINKNKFGRTFSIVTIPYAFKLLMQELQTMNVQMRIITEDNIDQLLSLSDSNNDLYKLSGCKSLNNYKKELKEIIRLDKVEEMNKDYPTRMEEEFNGISNPFIDETLQDSFISNQNQTNQLANIITNPMMDNSFYNSNIIENPFVGGEDNYQFNNSGYQGWNMTNTVPNNHYNNVMNNSMQEDFDVPLPDYKDKDGNINYDKYFDISPNNDDEKNRPTSPDYNFDGPNIIDAIQTKDGDEFSPEFNSNIKLEDLDDDYIIKFTDKDGKTLTGTIFAIAGDTIFVENDEWDGGITSEKEININDVVEIISYGHTPEGDPDNPSTQSGGNIVEHWDGYTTPTLNSSEQVWKEYDAFHQDGGGDDSDEDQPITKLKIGGDLDIKGLKTLSNIDNGDNNDNNDNNDNQSGGDGKKGITIDQKNL